MNFSPKVRNSQESSSSLGLSGALEALVAAHASAAFRVPLLVAGALLRLAVLAPALASSRVPALVLAALGLGAWTLALADALVELLTTRAVLLIAHALAPEVVRNERLLAADRAWTAAFAGALTPVLGGGTSEDGLAGLANAAESAKVVSESVESAESCRRSYPHSTSLHF
jgi:hypothetical protein